MARIVEKDPDNDATYTVDWTNQLATGVTIAGSTWTLPAPLTETTSSNTTTTTSVTVGGGVAGTTYEVTNDVTLSAGGPFDYLLYVLVQQQVLDEVRALPLSLSEIKHSLRVTHNEDDVYITDLLKAAVEYVESVTQRDLVSKTQVINLPRFDNCFELEPLPIRSVARIRYYDTDNVQQTLAVDQYSVYEKDDGSTVIETAIDATWPGTANRGDAVELLLVSGYGPASDTVPYVAKQLIRMIVRHWYDNPAGSVTGTSFNKTTPAIDAMIQNLKTGFYADI